MCSNQFQDLPHNMGLQVLRGFQGTMAEMEGMAEMVGMAGKGPLGLTVIAGKDLRDLLAIRMNTHKGVALHQHAEWSVKSQTQATQTTRKERRWRRWRTGSCKDTGTTAINADRR